MLTYLFDLLARLLDCVFSLLGGLLELAMRALSAISGFLFTPLVRGLDFLWDSVFSRGPWAALWLALGGALLVLILLTIVGWIMIAAGKNGTDVDFLKKNPV